MKRNRACHVDVTTWKRAKESTWFGGELVTRTVPDESVGMKKGPPFVHSLLTNLCWTCF